jgi:hypothetical protein
MWRLGVVALLLLVGGIVTFVLISGQPIHLNEESNTEGAGPPIRLNAEEFATPTEEPEGNLVQGNPELQTPAATSQVNKDNFAHPGQTEAVSHLTLHPMTVPETLASPPHLEPTSTPLPIFAPYVPGVLASPSLTPAPEMHSSPSPIPWPTPYPSPTSSGQASAAPS